VLHDLLEPSRGAPPRDEAAAQEILRSLLNELYNARDTKFTNLATQQNKVTWLVFVGLAIMAALVSQGYRDLLMAGAVGDILSRLQRELQRREVTSDPSACSTGSCARPRTRSRSRRRARRRPTPRPSSSRRAPSCTPDRRVWRRGGATIPRSVQR